MREASEARTPARPHVLTLEGREKAVVTGVEDVGSFNEQTVVLLTSAGALTLLGDGLHISRLNLQDGELLVEGRIAALEYDDRNKSGRGLLSRMFK